MLSLRFIFALLLLQSCISAALSDSSVTSTVQTTAAATNTSIVTSTTAAPTTVTTTTTIATTTATNPTTTAPTTTSTTTTPTTTATITTTQPPPDPVQATTCYAYPSLTNPCVKLCLGNSERIVLNIQYDDKRGMTRNFVTGVPQNSSVAISGKCATSNKNGQSVSRIHMQWPIGKLYFYRMTFGYKRNDKDLVTSEGIEYKGNWWLYEVQLHYANASYAPDFIDPLLNFSTVSYVTSAPYTNIHYAYYCPDELELTLSNSSVLSSKVMFSMGEYTVQGFNITTDSFSDLHQCNTADPDEVVNLIAVGVATGLAALVGVILVAYIAGRIWKRKKQASSYEVLA